MGRSDDSSDDNYSRKSRKKKKRRERSRSSSPGSDTSRHSSSRHKKSKKKSSYHDYRRSPSPDRRNRGRKRSRHRSRSADSRSPNRSKSRYSRSHSRERRSRDRDRRGRSRERRLRSPDRGSRSESTSRPESRRSSSDRHWDGTRHSDSPSSSSANIKGLTLTDASSSDLTASQLAEERMRAALRAAAAADEKLRLHSKLDAGGRQSPLDQNFADRVKAIEEDRFVAATFTSSKDIKQVDQGEPNLSHDAAIFGSLASTGFIIKPDTDNAVMDWAVDNLMHPSLYCDPDEKMDRWMDRLAHLRRRKLEGEALYTS